ncbi:hypothetical protein ABPG75_002414 [Micractinium tetrahymenae]
MFKKPTGVPGFITERLEAAAAVPAEQHTPEISGFIESCRLRDEVAALLEQRLPQAASERQRHVREVALRLVHADNLCAGAPLDFYHGGSKSWAIAQLRELADARCPTGWLSCGTSLEDQILSMLSTGHLSTQVDLDSLVLITATLQPPPVVSQLPVVARLLQLVLQPEARRLIEQQLAGAQADLTAPTITWEHLAGRVAEHAAHCCLFAGQHAGGAHTAALIRSTVRLCEQWLPQLAAAPGQPRVAPLKMLLALACALTNGPASWSAMAATLSHARSASSDYFLALAGYTFGILKTALANAGWTPPDSPADVLRWVQQAQAAHKRCKGLLPSVWTANLKDRRAPALAALPWLHSLAAAGTSWEPPGASATAGVAQGLFSDPNRNLRCAACGSAAMQLRACSGCGTRYCSRECQKKDWPAHKPSCQARQRERAAKGAAGGAGSM